MSDAPSSDEPRDTIVQTRHTAVIGGQTVSYTASAGTIVLKEEKERPPEAGGESEGERARAAIFFVAYTRDDVADRRARPITFSFNGGPGSASIWLHMGLLGPQRVDMGQAGDRQPAPPYRLAENQHSLLDHTDLVFIDPVSTGFSRVVPGEKPGGFHGFKKDIESVGDFIRLYATREGRWGSPKFLIGESYGTTRAAGLAGYLQQRHGMYLSGIMLVSVVLNFQTLLFTEGNDLPFVLFLPSYAAAAFYHGRLAPELQRDLRATLAEAEAFAAGPYAAALFKGAALDDAERAEVARLVARYTGLSAEYVLRSDLRVRDDRFTKELLRDIGRTVGRLDTRYTGMDRDSAGEHAEHDPSLSAIIGPYTALFNEHVRGALGFHSDLPYEVLTGRVHPWSYADHQNRFVDTAETLRAAMCANPHLRVHVASGYYDLATPHFATAYTLSHLGLAAELRANISSSFYEAGHMMYIHEPSLAQLKAELAAFLST
jgi:carboxypeptidase C (cathepsin A)